ncbi:MAG TPA: GspE/PulE family protein [Verrucomicrobiae bacterium]|nr:GspE/PulE family protein [Verrucomicrobiae bacterium]
MSTGESGVVDSMPRARSGIDGDVRQAPSYPGAGVSQSAPGDGGSRDGGQLNWPAIAEPGNTPSAVELVDRIIDLAIERRATDIHVDPHGDQLRVRVRIDGMLHDIHAMPVSVATEIVSRLKVLGGIDIIEHRHPQDGHFTRQHGGREVDFRVATAPVLGGEKVVVRILPGDRVLTGTANLGMEEAQLQVVRNLIAHPYGMLLATGPVGSGKTTTLYALLNDINTSSRNVMTIEDPVEYRLPGINQMQTDPRASFGFAEGLRAILRQDPNVVMVGEIRDEETATTAFKAAMTGVLVFSTLHTKDAPGSVDSLVGLSVARFMIAGALIGVIAQRLLRRICPHCREEYRPADELLKKIDAAETLGGKPLFHGKGCEHCFQTGYRGRTGAFEIMVITEPIRDAILRVARPSELRRLIAQGGIQWLRQSAWSKVLAGITTPEEYLRVVFT